VGGGGGGGGGRESDINVSMGYRGKTRMRGDLRMDRPERQVRRLIVLFRLLFK
jgi:hypothetical protein